MHLIWKNHFKSILVFRNRKSWFFETDLQMIRATTPIQTTMKNLISLLKIPELIDSNDCLGHFRRNGLQLGVYKISQNGNKAHLHHSLPGNALKVALRRNLNDLIRRSSFTRHTTSEYCSTILATSINGNKY